MKDLKHNISSVKDTSTASMIAVSLFEYYRALIFCPLQLLYLNYQLNHTSKGGHIVNDSFWLVQNAALEPQTICAWFVYLNAAKNVFALVVVMVTVSTT